MSPFDDLWLTTFGPLRLTHDGERVRGSYELASGAGSLDGIVEGQRLSFTYEDPSERGEGSFELTRGGRAFTGRYRPEGYVGWRVWDGERRGFDGLWQSSFGPLRLVEEDGGRVRGHYAFGGGSTLTGRVKGDRLAFRYREVDAHGRGHFNLANDGLSFTGTWRQAGTDDDHLWTGRRVVARPGRTWLVVLEAPWQTSLADPEYAFGHMLRAFFARRSDVEVRHRFFANADSLRAQLAELAFLADPVVLVVAAHGEADGVRAGGRTVAVEAVLEGLSLAGRLRLLHFSACLVMKGGGTAKRLQTFCDATGAAVSGYQTSVDWAGSALIEFAYLEMILSRGLAPAEAAEQLARLLPFSGDAGREGDAFPPAEFRIVAPRCSAS